jgi:hypothetical protein
MNGVTLLNRDLRYVLPVIVPVAWLMVTPSPILKLPAWSVDVKITSPPSSLTTSFSWMVTPPTPGLAVKISLPAPTYSNE